MSPAIIINQNYGLKKKKKPKLAKLLRRISSSTSKPLHSRKPWRLQQAGKCQGSRKQAFWNKSEKRNNNMGLGWCGWDDHGLALWCSFDDCVAARGFWNEDVTWRSQLRTLYSTLHKQVKLTDVQTEMMATGYTSASRGAAEHGGAGGRGATDEDKCCCIDCVELGINSQQQRYGSCLLKMLPMAAQGCALAMTAILLALIELQDVDEEGCQWEEKKKVSRGFLSVRGQMLGTSYNRVVSHTRTHTRARAHRQRERFKEKAALPGLSWRPF